MCFRPGEDLWGSLMHQHLAHQDHQNAGKGSRDRMQPPRLAAGQIPPCRSPHTSLQLHKSADMAWLKLVASYRGKASIRMIPLHLRSAGLNYCHCSNLGPYQMPDLVQ